MGEAGASPRTGRRDMRGWFSVVPVTGVGRLFINLSFFDFLVAQSETGMQINRDRFEVRSRPERMLNTPSAQSISPP